MLPNFVPPLSVTCDEQTAKCTVVSQWHTKSALEKNAGAVVEPLQEHLRNVRAVNYSALGVVISTRDYGSFSEHDVKLVDDSSSPCLRIVARSNQQDGSRFYDIYCGQVVIHRGGVDGKTFYANFGDKQFNNITSFDDLLASAPDDPKIKAIVAVAKAAEGVVTALDEKLRSNEALTKALDARARGEQITLAGTELAINSGAALSKAASQEEGRPAVKGVGE